MESVRCQMPLLKGFAIISRDSLSQLLSRLVGDAMTRPLMHFVACSTVAISLIVAAIAFGPRGVASAQTPIEGESIVGLAPRSGVIQGQGEMVTVSKNGEAVWVFSFETGRWHKQAIPEGQGRISPTVGRGVVAFRTRTMMFACSGLTGAWDSVELGDLKAYPTVGFNVTAFRAGNKIYAFSADSGKWDSAELEPDDVGNPSVGLNTSFFETKSRIYAYSGKYGKWDMVDRDKP